MKASDLFIQCLENEGVQYIFDVPGEENLDFLDSLSRSGIRLILTPHEQAAGFMDNMPYGGVKDSGLGREGVGYAMDDMTGIRALVIRQPH